MSETSAWNGQILGKCVSLAVCTDSATGIVITAAKSESAETLVYPDQLGEFLAAHSSAELICYDAAHDHWAMHDLLQRKEDRNGLETLWMFSHCSRLCDVGLLDQRLRLVRDGVYPRRKSLDQLSTTYGGRGLSNTDAARLKAPIQQGKMPAAEDLAAQARAVMAVYQDLHAQANQTAKKLGINEELVKKFGPLGIGIDVQGDIAVRKPNSRLIIDLERATSLGKACQDIYERSSRQLCADPRVADVFDWDGNRVAKDERGFLGYKEGKLRHWLKFRFDEFHSLNGRPLPPPLDDDREKISLRPENWGVLPECHPQLRDWSQLVASARTDRFFRSLDETRGVPDRIPNRPTA